MSPTHILCFCCKMVAVISLVIFALIICFTSTTVSDPSCSYHMPEYQNPQTCLEYDLGSLSQNGAYNITPPGSMYTYLVKVS